MKQSVKKSIDKLIDYKNKFTAIVQKMKDCEKTLNDLGLTLTEVADAMIEIAEEHCAETTSGIEYAIKNAEKLVAINTTDFEIWLADDQENLKIFETETQKAKTDPENCLIAYKTQKQGEAYGK